METMLMLKNGEKKMKWLFPDKGPRKRSFTLSPLSTTPPCPTPSWPLLNSSKNPVLFKVKPGPLFCKTETVSPLQKPVLERLWDSYCLPLHTFWKLWKMSNLAKLLKFSSFPLPGNSPPKLLKFVLKLSRLAVSNPFAFMEESLKMNKRISSKKEFK